MPSSSAPGAAQEEKDGDPGGWCVGPGPHPGAQPMSFPPVGARGHGLVLLTVGPPAVTAGCPGQAGPGPGGGWGCWEASGHLSTCVLDHGPSPPQTTEAQVGRRPALVFSLVSACPVGDSVSIPVLRSLLSLYHLFSPCVSVYALSAFSVSPLFLSLPFLCRLQLSPSFLLCSAHLSSCEFLFPVLSPLLTFISLSLPSLADSPNPTCR